MRTLTTEQLLVRYAKERCIGITDKHILSNCCFVTINESDEEFVKSWSGKKTGTFRFVEEIVEKSYCVGRCFAKKTFVDELKKEYEEGYKRESTICCDSSDRGNNRE